MRIQRMVLTLECHNGKDYKMAKIVIRKDNNMILKAIDVPFEEKDLEDMDKLKTQADELAVEYVSELEKIDKSEVELFGDYRIEEYAI